MKEDKLLLETDSMPGDRGRGKRYLGQTQAAWWVVGCREARPDRGVFILPREAWPKCVNAKDDVAVWCGSVEKCWERRIQRARKQQVKTDGKFVGGKMDVLPAGRYLCRDEISTWSSAALACSRAASAPSKATSRDVTSCSRAPAPPPSANRDPIFESNPIPAPGLLKQLVSSLVIREDCACAAERSCCSIASRWFGFPAEFRAAVAAEAWSFSRKRSRDSLRRFSSCRTILLPAVSTATPQEPPYCATNLARRSNVKDWNLLNSLYRDQDTWNDKFQALWGRTLLVDSPLT